MTVATFDQPDVTSDTPSQYKANIDASIAVLANVAGHYAPHEAATPNMTVLIDAGRLMDNGTLVSNAQQTTTTITAPVGNPRIDRIVINEQTGVYSIVAGTEATSPSAPAIPAGYLPCCQVLLDNSPATTAITNSLITDERTEKNNAGKRLIAVTSYQSGTSHTLNDATTHVILELVGGGAGGNGCDGVSTGAGYGGAGGGAGAYLKTALIAKTGSVDFVIGSGGSGGSAGGRGTSGSATTAMSGAYSAGPGYATGGLENRSVQPGIGGASVTSPTGYAADGGSGFPAQTAGSQGGHGGSSHFSGGGAGGRSTAVQNGTAGKRGAGGGGGAGDTTTRTGGAGGTGMIVIHEFG